MNKADYIREDESLEDLGAGNLFLIQKKKGFRFGTDAVLLADFAKDIQTDSILDLCTGSGIVPILLSHKSTYPLRGNSKKTPKHLPIKTKCLRAFLCSKYRRCREFH